MQRIWRGLACGILLLSGCVASPPLREGFHTDLPPRHTIALIWGSHPAVVAAATTWVLQRGLIVIEQSKLQPILAEAPPSEMPAGKDAAVLKAAKSLSVKVVVFITQSGDVRAPIVTVRGVDVETAQILWSGSARYPEYMKRPFSDLLVNLTCEALAAAWGLECTKKEACCSPSA
jgi:hypothetical protein